MKQIYINKKTQNWIDKLIDLFCLEDNVPEVILNPRWDNKKGYCIYATPKHNAIIKVGCKNGIRLTTLVHEFIHAMGYNHEWEINEWANFRSNLSLDNFSPLVVKDLTGKKEMMI